MANRREDFGHQTGTGTTGSRTCLGAPGTTGAQGTQDPLGAPGTTGAAPTSGGFNPASHDPAAHGQGQQHRSSDYDPSGYDLGHSQGEGQEHRPSGYDPSGYDLGHSQGQGQHRQSGYDPSGYDLGHSQGGGQHRHSGGAAQGEGHHVTRSGKDRERGARGHEKETIEITTTTGAFNMPGTGVGPISGYAGTTGLPTTTVTGVYGEGFDAGTTDVGAGDIGGGREGHRHGDAKGLMERIRDDLPGARHRHQ